MIRRLSGPCHPYPGPVPHLLAAARQPGGRASSAKRSEGAQASPGNRVLIVEDEIFAAWHLESILRGLKLDVCGLVANGAAAVEAANSLKPDLVLMDVNLGGGPDGIDTARRLQKAGLRIIYVTAYSDARTLGRIQEVSPGAPVLTKPVSPVRLRAALRGDREH